MTLFLWLAPAVICNTMGQNRGVQTGTQFNDHFPNGAAHRLKDRHVTPGEVAVKELWLPYGNH
jgi:hypothetical protein